MGQIISISTQARNVNECGGRTTNWAAAYSSIVGVTPGRSMDRFGLTSGTRLSTTQFRQDLRLHLPSYSLIGDNGELLGFGQYYVRVSRCHLARLVISPPHRGRALAEFLIRELCRIGCSDLHAKDCSLFVLESNASAINLYRRLGFVDVQYPGDSPSLAGVIYMVAPFDVLVTHPA